MPSKKHNAKQPTDLNIQAKSPREFLFLQFAQTLYQEMLAVGKNTSFGQALHQADGLGPRSDCQGDQADASGN